MTDPYVYPNTYILKNKANIKDHDKLQQFESANAILEILRLEDNPIKIVSAFDILKVHQEIFKNTYYFAGEIRKINIYKRESVLNGISVEYSDYSEIEKKLKAFDKDFFKIDFQKLHAGELLDTVAKYMARLWQIHPFREGNTRSTVMFFYLFLTQNHIKLNNTFIGSRACYFRNALVLASIGEYSEFDELKDILSDSLSKRSYSKNNDKYETIKGFKVSQLKEYPHEMKK